MDFLFEVVVILGLILANGVLAMTEIAVVSARKTRLQQRSDNGDAGAKAALALADKPDQFLSTVQIGITLIATLTGAFGGATLASEVAVFLAPIDFLAPYAESLSLFLVVLIITYLSLVLGELTPKRIGMNASEGIAVAMARPMTRLARLTSPLVALLSASTGFVMRLLRIQTTDDLPITEEEILMMMEAGSSVGVFEQQEQDLVGNVFRFADRRVSAMITPHTELDWLDTEDAEEDNWRIMANSAHNTFPVAEGNLDAVLGVVSVKDVWAKTLDGEVPKLRDVLSTPLFIPESTPAFTVLERFRKERVDAALVLDEYGGVMGLITLTDLLEGLVGRLPVSDKDSPAIVQRKDGSYLIDGLLPIDQFEAFFEVDAAPEGEQDFQTVGGFVMQRLGRIPQATDVFAWEGLHIEVIDMDKMRVDKVLVSSQATSDDEQQEALT